MSRDRKVYWREQGGTPRPRGLVLLAHGSREKAVREELAALADAISARVNAHSRLLHVVPAFLTLGKPDLAAAVREARDKGALTVDILPLFVFSGAHVRRNIPELFKGLKGKHRDMELRLLPHLGASDGLVAFVAAVWREGWWN